MFNTLLYETSSNLQILRKPPVHCSRQCWFSNIPQTSRLPGVFFSPRSRDRLVSPAPVLKALPCRWGWFSFCFWSSTNHPPDWRSDQLFSCDNFVQRSEEHMRLSLERNNSAVNWTLLPCSCLAFWYLCRYLWFPHWQNVLREYHWTPPLVYEWFPPLKDRTLAAWYSELWSGCNTSPVKGICISITNFSSLDMLDILPSTDSSSMEMEVWRR